MLAAIAAVSVSALPAQTAHAAINQYGVIEAGTTTLNGNLNQGKTLACSVTATLNGNGYTISRNLATDYPVITVRSGAVLTINNATIDGGYTFTQSGDYYINTSTAYLSSAPLILVKDGGRLILNNCTVQNNVSSENGGGIYIEKDGAVDMFDSTVQKCRVTGSSSGGGIYNLGILAMVGGNVRYNQAGGSGGGICQTSGAAPALYINKKEGYTDKTVNVTRNLADSGAGLAIIDGDAWIYGTQSAPVKVESNVACQGYNYIANPDGTGGGVYVGLYAKAHIYNFVSIQYNSAGNGGGIYTVGSTWLGREGTTSTRMVVAYNSATNYGGGIWSGGGAGTWLGKITVFENTAQYGGGAYIHSETTAEKPFAVTSTSLVSSNTASTAGADGVLTLEYKPYIGLNKVGSANSNVYLSVTDGKNSKINIVQKQTDNKDSGTQTVPIGLSSDMTSATKIVTTNYTVTNSLALSDVFTTDNTDYYGLSLSGGEVQMNRYVKVTYAPYNCTGSAKTVKVGYNQATLVYSAAQAGFSKTGYSLLGWSLVAGNSVATYGLTHQPAFKADTTLYPVWSVNRYTLTYDGNGNTGGSMSTREFTYGQTANLSSNGFTKTGYNFLGWSFDQNATTPTYLDGASFTYNYTSDKTLYAVWSNKFDVTFDANGATGTPPSSVQQTSNSSFNLPSADGLTYAGYAFDGWLCDADKVTYQAGASYTMPAKDVSFTAQWKPLYSYTVKHYLQNVADDEYTLDVTETLSGTGTTQAVAKDYAGFTAQAFSQATIAADGSTVVEIFYNRNSYTLTFNAKGGNISSDTLTAKYGAPITLPVATRNAYTFVGWSETDGGSTAVNYTTMPAESKTLYAIWKTRAVTSISVPAEYQTQAYLVNDALKAFQINIIYDNGDTGSVDVTSAMVSGFSTAAVATSQTATVSYGGKTATFTYSVTQGYAYKALHHFEDIDGEGYGTDTATVSETLYGTGTTQAVAKNYPGFTAPATIEQKAISADGTTQVDIYYTRNSYTVTFDANGGEFPANATTTLPAKYGASVSVAGITAPAKTGFVFIGWNTSADGTGTSVDKSGNYTVTAETNQNLYAVYEAKAVDRLILIGTGKTEWYVGEAIGDYYFTVCYNDGTQENISVSAEGVEVKNFDTSTATGTGETKTATIKYGGKQVSFTYTVVVRTYSVTYDANGASGEPPITTPAPSGFNLTVQSGASLTKTGYTFTGWLYSGDGNVYESNDTITMPAQDVTFTAQWSLKSPDLAFGNILGGASPDFTYDFSYDGEAHQVTVTATHELVGQVDYTYAWYRLKAGGTPIPSMYRTEDMLNSNCDQVGETDTYGFTEIAHSGTHYCLVKATYGSDTSIAVVQIYVTVSKGEQAELTFSQTEITYAGENIYLSLYVSGGSGDGAITFSKVSSSGITHGTFGTDGVIQNVTKAGGTFSFKVKKAASSDGNYKAAEKEFTLTINKGVQNIVIGDIQSPTFGNAYDLTATGNVGTVAFETITGGTATGKIEKGKLSVSDRGTDGTITVKATAAETDLWAQGTAQKTFTFAKASYDSAPEFSGNIPAQTYTLCVGRALSEITLPTYWSWQDGQSLPNQTGTYDRTATFTPASPDNYEGTEATISITVAAHNSEGAATSNNDGTHSHTCSVCSATITENCTYGDWVITVEPGVNKEGSKYRDCTECGYRDTQVIPATHTCVYDAEFTVDIAPTCTTAGEKSRHCTTAGCDERVGITVIPALGHSWGDWIVTTPATCTTDGVETRTCAHDSSHTETRAITAIGHSWGDWTVKKAPTAQTTGELERICANDSSHTDSFVLPALNNSDYVYSVVTAPGCETTGTGKYSYTKDNKTFDFTVTLAVAGHTLTPHVAKAATCTEDGNTEYWTCSVCGKYFSNSAGTNETTLNAVTISAIGHSWGEWIVTTPATCTENGVETRTCTHDASHTEIRAITATGHVWGEWTSNNNGTHTHACTHDGSHTETEDCTYQSVVVAPTCTTKGYTRHTCTVCGYSYDDTPTDETPHTLTAHAAVSPTHTKSGNIAYWTCNVCNKYFSDESGETEISLNDTVLQATGHSHSSEWKSDVSGHWHECSCGDKADVSAHTPGAAATETTPQTCTVCGYIISPATGHVTHTPDTTWHHDGTNHWHKCVGCEEKLDVAQHSGGTATCERKAECSDCGAEYGEIAAHSYGEWAHYSDTQHKRVCSVNADHVEYADHAWNDGVITTAPTHTAAGVKTYTCADCGHTKAESIPATAEHFYNLEIAEARFLKSAATCTQKAVYYKSCACGERGTATFEYGGYAAHTLTAHEAVAATCTQNGNIAYWSCSVCNKYFSDSTGETEITQAQTVTAAGHNYVFTRTVAPNLEAQTDGYDLWTCTRDESHTERRNIVEWETLIADKVTVMVSGGTIQGQSGSSIIVNKNGNVTVVADEIEGKTFVGWRNANGDIVSENATYTFRASADMTLTAVYEDVTSKPKGLSGGAIAGIAVGGVAIAGFGGFAIFWFAVKKKSFADLLAAVKRKK